MTKEELKEQIDILVKTNGKLKAVDFNPLLKLIVDTTGEDGAALEVDKSIVNEATEGAILYVSNGKLSQIQGLNYDTDKDTLQYQDSAQTMGLTVGQYEVAPGVFMPVFGVTADNGFTLAYFDQSSLGGNKQGIFGFQNDSSINVKYGDNINIEAVASVNIDANDSINFSSVNNVNFATDEYFNINARGSVNVSTNNMYGMTLNENELLFNDINNLGAIIHRIGRDATFTLGALSGSSNHFGSQNGIHTFLSNGEFVLGGYWYGSNTNFQSNDGKYVFSATGAFNLNSISGTDEYFQTSDGIHKFSLGGIFSIDGGTLAGTGTGTLGFFGSGPISQPTLPLGSTTDAVITALQALGLVKES